MCSKGAQTIGMQGYHDLKIALVHLILQVSQWSAFFGFCTIEQISFLPDSDGDIHQPDLVCGLIKGYNDEMGP